MPKTATPKRTAQPVRAQSESLRERRAPADATGSINWVKSILGRPLTLERRGSGLHIVLTDRRRSPEAIQAESIARLREELRVRLLQLELHDPNTAMRHLVFVHDTLGRQGWRGLQAINSAVLKRAVVQLGILIEREPSKRLSRLAAKLRFMQAGAEAREERQQLAARDVPEARDVPVHERDSTQVSEVSAEEYEASEREWAATFAGELTAEPPPTRG